LAFALGNPALNIAVLVWITFALGWQWTLLRMVVGTALVVGVAMLAVRLRGDSDPVPPPVAETPIGSDQPWVLRWAMSLVKWTVLLIPLMIAVALVMGAARAFLFPSVGPAFGNNPLAIIGFALAGTLFPIPTGAEIPIIQTMMGFGLGAGPAGALLLTLAPINLASMGMMLHAFPKRVIAIAGASTFVAGLVAGLIAAVAL
jgi:hypothetical protein